MDRPELFQNTPRERVSTSQPVLPYIVPARFVGTHGIRWIRTTVPDPHSSLIQPHVMSQYPYQQSELAVESLAGFEEEVSTHVVTATAGVVSHEPARPVYDRTSLLSHQRDFKSTLDDCLSLDELSMQVEEYCRVIPNALYNIPNEAHLWSHIIKRIRTITSNRATHHRSFLDYPSLTRVIIIMTQKLESFNLSCLGYTLLNLADTIKTMSPYFFRQSPHSKEITQCIRYFFSGIPHYIDSLVDRRDRSRADKTVNLVCRIYVALHILKKYDLIIFEDFTLTSRKVISHLDTLMTYADPGTISQCFLGLSAENESSIYFIGEHNVKTFFGKLICHAKQMIGRHSMADIRVIMLSLSDMLGCRDFNFLEHDLFTEYMSLLLESINIENFQQVKESDAWTMLLQLVKLKKILPMIECEHLFHIYDILFELSTQQLMRTISISNTDDYSRHQLANLLKDVEDQRFSSKGYIYFYRAFRNCIESLNTPVGDNIWHIQHLAYLHHWIATFFLSNVPDKDSYGLSQWLNHLLYMWLDSYVRIMIQAKWKMDKAGFAIDSQGLYQTIHQSSSLFHRLLENDKIYPNLEVLSLLSLRDPMVLGRSNLRNERTLQNAQLVQDFCLCCQLLEHISQSLKVSQAANHRIVLYGSALFIEYLKETLFKGDMSSTLTSKLIPAPNDFDLLFENEQCKSKLSADLQKLPESLSNLVICTFNEYAININNEILYCRNITFQDVNMGRNLLRFSLNHGARWIFENSKNEINWQPYIIIGNCFLFDDDPAKAIRLYVPDINTHMLFMRDSLSSPRNWQRKNRTLLSLIAVCVSEEKERGADKVGQEFLLRYYAPYKSQIA